MNFVMFHAFLINAFQTFLFMEFLALTLVSTSTKLVYNLFSYRLEA